MSHARKTAELDARGIEVHFSERVRSAFADLAAAVHFSDHFDPGMLETLQEWTAGKNESLRGVLISLPIIAKETFTHIQATGDKRAEEAWQEICDQIPEKNGFTLVPHRGRGK
ncbi:MAG TPA: hypothetical protein VMI06_10600 [Terriglobia bacterium]|nr:hypothetical protein [Terriglobia bacterium]